MTRRRPQGTRAAHPFLLPVHLYGQVADVAALAALAGGTASCSSRTPARPTAPVATAAGAGTGGLAAAFSDFYPGKNLGAFGDAGALVSDDPGARAA